ncbi:MAG: hypothetical protein HQL49_00015 [Gammaproteobacteria bacterium]|nr:hypothetical protein [Gammaproteobacteria bacterium]
MSDLESSSSGGVEQMLRGAVRRVLRALVRLLVHQGFTFPELVEILKGIYVEEVEKELKMEGERCTHSRISLISGVHRKDVRRLLESRENALVVQEKVSLTARLLSIWSGDPKYLDEEGNSLPLAKIAASAGEVAFDTLVLEVSQDLRSRTILDEWQKRGIVSIDAQQRVQLNRDAMFPSDDIEAKLHYFARNTADHIAACDHNLIVPEHPFPERSLFFDGLSLHSVTELERLCRHRGQDTLLAVNREALRLAAEDDAGAGGGERFTFGFYFYREGEADHEIK